VGSFGRMREKVVFATLEGVAELDNGTIVDCSQIRSDLLECFFDSLLHGGDQIVGFRLGGNLLGSHSIDLLFQRLFPVLR
jgi:hypothetical protein